MTSVFFLYRARASNKIHSTTNKPNMYSYQATTAQKNSTKFTKTNKHVNMLYMYIKGNAVESHKTNQRLAP